LVSLFYGTMAIRNIRRRKLRNLLTIIAIALSTSLLVGVISSVPVIPAQFLQMATKAIGVIDIEIHSGLNLPIEKNITSVVLGTRNVTSASPRVTGAIQVWNGTDWVSTTLYGVNSTNNGDFDYLDPNTNITGSRNLGQNGTVVDDAFGFKIGDTASLRIPTEEGYEAVVYNLTVYGIYHSGTRLQGISYVGGRIYVDLTIAQEIFGYSENEVDLIIAEVANTEKTDEIANEISSRLGIDYIVSAPRSQQTKELTESMVGLTSGISIVPIVVILIGGITILLVSFTNVNERTREIGILRTIGSSTTQIFCVFISESLILGAIGVLLGLIFGATIVTNVFQNLLSAVIHAESVEIPVQLQTLVIATVVGVCTAIGASAYPSLLACQKKPIEALWPTVTKPLRTSIPLINIDIQRGRIAPIAVVFGAALTVLGWYSYLMLESYQLFGLGFFMVSVAILTGTVVGVILLIGGLLGIGERAKLLEKILPLPASCRMIAARNIQRNVGRTIALFVIIGVAASLSPLLMGAEIDTTNGMTHVIRSFLSADITIMSGSLIPKSFATNLTLINNGTLVSDATPLLIVPQKTTLLNNMSNPQAKLSATILAIDPGSYGQVMPITFTENTPTDALKSLETEGTIILASPVATSLNATIGSTVQMSVIEWGFNPENPWFPVPIQTWKNFKVVGIITAAFIQMLRFPQFSLGESCYISYNSLNNVFPMFGNDSNMFYLKTKTEDTANVKTRIKEDYGNYELSFVTFDDVLNIVKPSLNAVFFIFDIMQWFALAITTVSILVFMWINVLERVREIGILISIGTSKLQNIAVILGEAALYGLLGFFSSIPMGVIFHRFSVGVMSAMGFATTFTMPYTAFAISFALSITTSIVGSLLPVWKATGLNAVEAIRYTE
jgi:putative ABC transport system permease protein